MPDLTTFFHDYPNLHQLYQEAVVKLAQCFDHKGILTSALLHHEGDTYLRLRVLIEAKDIPDPDTQLAAFDQWWLTECHKSGGQLIVDYIMQH